MIDELPDHKQAALNMFPHEWLKFDDGFQIDSNAQLRLAAEKVLLRVFSVLRDHKTAKGVADAFLARQKKYGSCDNQMNTSMMATALLVAVHDIRDKTSDTGVRE